MKRALKHFWKDVVCGFWPMLKDTFHNAGEDNVPRMGAALAYYTIFSVAPLLMFVLAIATIYEGQKAADGQLSAELTRLMGAPTAAAIQSMVVAASRKRVDKIITIVSIAILFIGASGAFAELQDSLNTIWEVKPKPNRGLWGILHDRLLSFAMVFAIGFLLLASLVISAGLATFDTYYVPQSTFFHVLWVAVTAIVSIAVITVMFAAVFKSLPDVRIHWMDVWIGALATAVLFSLGKWALSEYVSKAGVANSYGATGALVVFVLWIYYSAQIFLIGAEFTRVYANRFGSRVLPDSNAIGVTPETRAQQGLIDRDALLRERQRLLEITRDLEAEEAKLRAASNGHSGKRILPAMMGFAAGMMVARVSKRRRRRKVR